MRLSVHVADGFFNTNMRFSWVIYTSILTYAVTPAVTFEFSRDYAWMFEYVLSLVYVHCVNFGNGKYIPQPS